MSEENTISNEDAPPAIKVEQVHNPDDPESATGEAFLKGYADIYTGGDVDKARDQVFGGIMGAMAKDEPAIEPIE